MAEEFTRCCYGVTLARACGPGTARRAAPVGPIGWAGSEGSDVWDGYMAPSALGAAPPPRSSPTPHRARASAPPRRRLPSRSEQRHH
jgi:hypothetical protein